MLFLRLNLKMEMVPLKKVRVVAMEMMVAMGQVEVTKKCPLVAMKRKFAKELQMLQRKLVKELQMLQVMQMTTTITYLFFFLRVRRIKSGQAAAVG